MLTLKIKTSSSAPDKTKWTISLQEGSKTAVTNTNVGSAAEWINCGVLINKTEDNTSLTIKANMLPGGANNGQHYVMMIDDVQLKYLSTADIENVNADNALDVSGVIYNAGIYNANKANMPRGWTAHKSTRGNSNFTEATGDTRLEGWSGGNLDIDYYQQIAGLPAGKYRMTATCGDSNDRGAYAYIYNADTNEKVTVDMGTAAADITTPSIIVNEGNAINIGIAGDNLKNGSWVTGDNFRLEYLATGIDLTAWKAAKADAEAALAEYDEKYAATERAAVVTASAATPSTDEEAVSMPAELNTKIATYRKKAANEKLMDEKKSLTDAIARIKTEYPNSSDEVLKTDLSKWTTSTYTVMNNREHWSGANSYKYYEQSSAQWGQNSWSIYAEQTVNLPVGKYAFVVTVRAAAETTSKMTVNGEEYELCHKGASGYGIATDGEATFDMAKTYANSNNGYGWEYAYAEFEITEAKDVTFRFDASTSTVHNWVSIADPVLYYNDDAKEAMELVRKNGIIALIADVLGEEDANVPTGKMNAEVQAALDAAVAAAKAGTTDNTVDELTGFKTALETAIVNANTSIANYAKVEPYNTKAADLDTDGQAAYAETLAAYNNGTLTKDGEEAQAKTAYIAAVKAQTTPNSNMTDALNNPSFEEGTGGWTNVRNTTGTYDYKTVTDGPADGRNVLNAWAPQFNYSNVYQKVTLHEGTYTLSAKVRTNAEPLNTEDKNTQIRTYVNGQKTSNSESLTTWRTDNWNAADAWVTLTTTFYIAEKTEVEMGIYSSGENLTNNSRGWFQVDDFQLIYLGNAYDYVENGVHYYVGNQADLTVELTDEVPEVDLTGATLSGTTTVTATNPNGLVYTSNASTISAENNIVVDGTCAKLVLTDGHPFKATKEFTATSASYNMTALAEKADGKKFGTLMLPFAVSSIPNSGKAYTLDQVSINEEIHAAEATTIAANAPVIVTAAGTYSASNVDITATNDTYTNGELVGTYKAMEAPVNTYVLQKHDSRVAFYMVGDVQPTVNPFRAYIKAQSAGVKALNIVFDDELTGIEKMEDGQLKVENVIFDLSGRRVQKAQKGAYIINGKKVLK